MNFFQHQDMARRNTRRLVILLGLATLTLIAITTVAFAVVVLGLNTEGYVSYAEQGLWPTLKSVLSWQSLRSEERRVGKECGVWSAAEDNKRKQLHMKCRYQD